MQKKHSAIITATISPDPRMTHLAIRDPLRRIAEYKRSLRWLVEENAFEDIVFAENSGFLETEDGQSFIAAFDGKVNFLSSKGMRPDPERGKGLPEALLIAEALRSPPLQQAEMITKISGRYLFRNARAYTSALGLENKIYCQVWRNLTYCDTRVFTFKAEFFEGYVENRINDIDDSAGVYIEHCLARSVHELLMKEGAGWGLPPVRPHLDGVSGSTGSHGSNGYRQFFYDRAYSLLRRMIER